MWPRLARACTLRADRRRRLACDMVRRIPVVKCGAHGRTHPRHGREPVVDRGRQPAKATVGEPFPVSATVFREGHDKLGAEVVLTGPDGVRRRPGPRWPSTTARPDRYEAWVTPDAEGAWTFEVQAWSDPIGHLAARRRAQDPRRRRRRADVHRGPAAARAGPRSRSAARARRRTAGRSTARDRRRRRTPADRPRPGWRRCRPPTWPACSPRTRCASWSPSRGPSRCTPTAQRALFGAWYEFFPRSEGATRDPETGKVTSGTFRTARQAARRRRRDGLRRRSTCRRSTRSARSTARAPTTPSTPGPTTPARPGRSAPRTAATTPSTPTSAPSRTSTPSWRRATRARAGGRARPRPAGAPDHPWVDDAPRVVHHPRRRHDRLRREPAEEVPGHLPDQLRQRPRPASAREVLRIVRLWMSHGVRIFRVDNPHTKPVAFWEWLLRRGPHAPTPTCSSWPRRSPGRR